MNQIEEVLNGINDFMQKAPREFNCEIYNRGRVEGSSAMYLKVCYSFYMSQKVAEFAADPLRTIGKPVEASWDWITHVQVYNTFFSKFVGIIVILHRIKKFLMLKVLITVGTKQNQDQLILVMLTLNSSKHFVTGLKQLHHLTVWLK